MKRRRPSLVMTLALCVIIIGFALRDRVARLHATAIGGAITSVISSAAGTGNVPAPQSGPGTYRVEPQPPAGACHYRWTADRQPLPDPNCTPGAINPQVTQTDLADTICSRGWTATIRPPVSVTSAEKRGSAVAYDYRGSFRDAEYDHLVSLELGGSANDPRNLWVEPPSPDHQARDGVNNDKDKVENELNHLVCNAVHLASRNAGSATRFLPLNDAQALIATNWTTALSLAPRYEQTG